MTSDIDVLIPDIGSIELSTGIVLEFHKFKWKQTKEVLTILQRYFRVVADPSDENIRYFAAGLGEEITKDIETLLSIVTRKTAEEVQAILEDLYNDEAIAVFKKAIDINISFFRQQFLPTSQKPVEEKTGE